MNQDQVKVMLLELNSEMPDFSVIFSGKISNKVDGLYHPEKQEIIIHNKNFTEDDPLIYTAIHELAHHIQFTTPGIEVTSKSHSSLFWDIFHKLLEVAEHKEFYTNLFKTDERFKALTAKIKSDFIQANGRIIKDFGKILIEALDLCQQNHANFEDYIDRELGINRTSAKSIMKVYAQDVNPKIGFDNMKIVSNIKEPVKRAEAEAAFLDGESQYSVKESIKESKNNYHLSIAKLEAQKKRIEKSIISLQGKLNEVEIQIEEAENE